MIAQYTREVSMAFLDEKFETMPADEIKAMQLKLLKDLVKRTYKDSAFYRKKMDDAGVKPEDIQTLDDIRKLPTRRTKSKAA